MVAFALFLTATFSPARAQDGAMTSGLPPMTAAKAAPKARSTELTLIFGSSALTLSSAGVAALPHETVTVVNGHTKASETYSGVPVSALLGALQTPFVKANEHALLRSYFVAEGTDGYRVLVSVYETLAAIRGTDAIVADSLVTQDGRMPLSTDGAFKLVIPGDSRPQRWVQNLKSLTFKIVQ